MLGKKLHRSVVEYLEARLAAPGFAPVAHPAAVPVKITKKRKAKPLIAWTAARGQR